MDLAHIDIVKLAIDILISGIIIFIVAKLLPGIEIENFGSALIVAIVYGVLNALITLGFSYIGLDSINRAVSQGIFQVIFNAILLMLTDKVVEGFYIKNFWYALLGALVFALLSSLAHQFIH
jgi:putative membrane protein